MTTPQPPRPDDQQERLRALLDDAVAHVEPAHGLGAIRTRTKVTPMSAARPWLLAAGAAVLATAATITVVNLAGTGSPTATPGPAAAGTTSPSSPARSPDAGPSTAAAVPSAGASTSASAPAAGATLPVYYVGKTFRGPRLYREFHASAGGFSEAAAVQQAVGTTPQDPDYATLWPTGTTVNNVGMSGDTIVVDLGGAALHDRPAALSKAQAEMSVEQVIYTAQAAFQTRAPVRLLIDGKITDQVLGVPTSEPLSQGDASSTLAQVWIIDPAQGATVSSGFRVSGLAAAFEANVQWELVQGTTVVKKGFTTARECCTMAPYSFTVSAPPGDYTIVVHDEDASGAGRAVWQDTKDVTIR
ncbi:MAG: Gmad2 immunoglobulin-like domain-containing protein [Nocardioides sp.]